LDSNYISINQFFSTFIT